MLWISLVPGERTPGLPGTQLCHPLAERTSPKTLIMILSSSADDMIRSDGRSNTHSAGEVRAG